MKVLIRQFLAAICLFAAGGGLPAAANPFPVSDEIRPRVDFWKQVFTRYSSNHLLLHDARYPEKIYKVLDISRLAASEPSPRRLRRQLKRIEAREKQALDERLRRIHRVGANTALLDPESRRIVQMFNDVPDRNRFRDAIGRARIQRGVGDRFRNAIRISGRYLPSMEMHFVSQGLPVELTRLPFVESSFNIHAYSKSAAAGVWQFIPSTARIYMRMNRVIDDRIDPWFATVAAAKHLRDDIDLLQKWPLAVTAYNFGRNGIRQALEQTGGDSLDDLIAHYRGPRFGFAAQNFYAEFVAAVEVYEERARHFPGVNEEPRLRFDEVINRSPIRFSTLAGLARMTREEFAQLNPGYTRAVVRGEIPVPAGHTIRVRYGEGESFGRAYANLAKQQTLARAEPASRRPVSGTHRVERGESLASIARLYNTSIGRLAASNQLPDAHLIQVGQLLRIPAAGPLTRRSRQLAAGRQPVARCSMHRVVGGDTVASIARNYGTTIAGIQAVNSLADVRYIQPGQVLTLPGCEAAAAVAGSGENT